MREDEVNAEALLKEIELLMDAEEYAAARALLLEHEALASTSAKLAAHLAWAAFKLERLDEASDWLHSTLSLDPTDAFAHWALGHVHMIRDEFEDAEREFLRSLVLKDASKARSALGFLYQREGKLEQARGVHLEGIRLQPHNADRCEAYADFLSDLGRKPEAGEYYERARELRAARAK